MPELGITWGQLARAVSPTGSINKRNDKAPAAASQLERKKEVQRDRMRTSERIGEIAAIIGIIVEVLFFYVHQAWFTGSVTSAFGPMEVSFIRVAIWLTLGFSFLAVPSLSMRPFSV